MLFLTQTFFPIKLLTWTRWVITEHWTIWTASITTGVVRTAGWTRRERPRWGGVVCGIHRFRFGQSLEATIWWKTFNEADSNQFQENLLANKLCDIQMVKYHASSDSWQIFEGT